MADRVTDVIDRITAVEGASYLQRTLDVVLATSACTGEAYFETLVTTLVRETGCAFAFVAELGSGGERLHTVAFATDLGLRPNVEYMVQGTPCELVLRSGLQHFRRDVAELFPDDAALREMGVTCYLGVRLVDEHGRPVGVLAVLDRTELEHAVHSETVLEIAGARCGAELVRRRAEHRLRRQTQLESLGRIAGGVIHDFNNLFTAILGNVELGLMRVGDNDRVRDNLGQIREAVDAARALSEQVLSSTGKRPLRREAVDLDELVAEATRLLEGRLERVGDFVLDVAPGLTPVLVSGDRAQLRQVVWNLVLNAAEATVERHPSGGGSVLLSTGNAVFEAPFDELTGDAPLPPGRYVVLTVEDDGDGIEDPARVFEPFFTNKARGHGLGLAVVDAVVRRHGGGITIERRSCGGARVTVYLPATD